MLLVGLARVEGEGGQGGEKKAREEKRKKERKKVVLPKGLFVCFSVLCLLSRYVHM